MTCKRKLYVKLFCLILASSLLSFSAVGCLQIQKLPEPQISLASEVLDVNGKEITKLFKENRVEVNLAEISDNMEKAVIAVEDSRFYEHSGIDVIGIGRATVKNLRAGRVVEGGSTISQQTAKNLYLSNERTFTRKAKELLYTLQLERRYTKDEILNMYLNQIYFGKGAYGVEVASQTYFGKPAQELNLAESAMLAGVPKSPNSLNPFNDFDAAKARQAVVLNRMVELGVINANQAKQAKTEEISLKTSAKLETQTASFFIDMVREYITEKFPDQPELLYRGGLTIETTLDLDMQVAAELAVSNGLKDYPSMQAALVALDPKTGYMKAIVGGRDSTSKFNRAIDALRQPGSTMKPFVYAAAIDNGYTPASTFKCEPVEFKLAGGKTYKPTDYGNSYHNRDFTLKEALAVSDNLVAVKLNEAVGPETVVKYAKSMGINSPLAPILSLALGTKEVSPLELAAGFVPLANQGVKAKPVFVLSIKDKNGNTLDENKPFLSKVLDEKTAYIVTDMLKAVLEPGGTGAAIGQSFTRPMAAKTGSTNEYRDAWFVGFTPDLVTSVWAGNDDPAIPAGRSGGALSGPIWREFNQAALAKIEPRDFPIPAGIVKVKICADSGLLATPNSEKVIEAAFIEGTEPTEECPVHKASNWFEDLLEGDNGTDQGQSDGRSNEERGNDWNILDWFR